MIESFLKALGKTVKEGIESAVVFSFFGLFQLLGLPRSRCLMGWLAKKVGPFLKQSRTAKKNLSRVFPDMSLSQQDALILAMWEHLGFVVAEYAHLDKLKIFDSPTVTLKGVEHLQKLQNDGQPGLVFSGHLGNWELIALAFIEAKIPMSQVYRAANNRSVNALIRHLQRLVTRNLIPKGPEGGRKTLEALKAGDHLILLIDQKMNNGIAVDFFGYPAMTSSGLARLAQKFSCPVLPAQVERIAPDRFEVTFHPPFIYQHGDGEEGARAFMATVHAYLESWIRKRPEQWLWIHNRWP